MKNKMKLLTALGILAIIFSLSFKPLNYSKTIVIDAGHGGKDVGAEVDGKKESQIVESIAKKIQSLNNQDLKIILLRKNDDFIGINDRISEVNKIKPDLLISIHTNFSNNQNLNGINAYISKANTFYNESKNLAHKLINSISDKNLSKGKVSDRNLIILKDSNCPAVTLEIGFLSNRKDRNFISSKDGQNRIAKKILEVVKQ